MLQAWTLAVAAPRSVQPPVAPNRGCGCCRPGTAATWEQKMCGATEPRRTPLKLSETTLEARAVNIAEVVFGHGSAQIPFRISAQSAPACMVKVFPDACPKIRRPGLLLTPSNDDVQCFLLAKNHQKYGLKSPGVDFYQPLSNPSLLRSLLYPLDPLGSFRHDSIPTGSPPRVPHPWATGEDGAGRALAEGIDHMLHLSGIDQGLIMGPT